MGVRIAIGRKPQVSQRRHLVDRLRGLREPAALRAFVLRVAGRAFSYVILADLSFIFLFPILYMLATSLKSWYALNDPTVRWLPPSPEWSNYALAFAGLRYAVALKNTMIISFGSAILQVVSCSFVGYGLARLRFHGREIIFWLVMFSFLVPPQTIVVGLFVEFHRLGLLNTFWAFLIPAALGNGMKAPLFILIFRQFYRTLPWELEEAARVDGAGTFTTYLHIVLPLARPAVVVVFLLSLVWYWNAYWEPVTFLNNRDLLPLSIRLDLLAQELQEQLLNALLTEGLHEGILMAGCVLIIAPLLAVYAFTQRFLVQSIDRTGLVE